GGGGKRAPGVGEPFLDSLARPCEMLDAEREDDSARVDDEVGRVENPRFAETFRSFGRGELIVRRSGNDAAAEPRDGLEAQCPAERARCVDVTLDADRVL